MFLVSIGQHVNRLLDTTRQFSKLQLSENKGNTHMKVMVAVKATKESELGKMPSEKLLSDMMAFNEELVKAGIMLDGAGLQPSSKGVRIRFSASETSVVDGPFAETKELIAGYWVWQVKSMEEAIEWAKRCPPPMPDSEESMLEIRPYFESEDFGPEMTEQLQQREQALANQITAGGMSVGSYLFFSGRCEQALEFYKHAAGANVDFMMRFNESPDQVPDGMLQAGFENKIMHASFRIGETTIMASDGCDDKATFSGFRLVLKTSTEADAHRLFNGLATGGKVDMPLCKTFWSPCYGMLTDKFDVGWMVMVPGPTS
jgi:uncharacterized glyoxalase superfamily protein PhnB